jgi:hypothetical protein
VKDAVMALESLLKPNVVLLMRASATTWSPPVLFSDLQRPAWNTIQQL